MSKNKQITESMLKAMIQEVLNEERLNEISITIDPTKDWKGLKKDVGLNSLSQIGQPKSATAAKAIKDLAGLDNDGKNLTDDDLKAATGPLKKTADAWYANSSKTATDRTTHTDLDAYLSSLSGPAIASIADCQLAGLAKWGKKNGKDISRDKVTTWKNAIINKHAIDPTAAQSLFMAFAAYKYLNANKALPTGPTSAYVKTKAALGNPSSTSAELEASFNSLIDVSNPDIEGEDRFPNPFGTPQVDSGIESSRGALSSSSTMNQLRVKADSSAVEMFGSIPGTTVDDKLEYIISIAVDVQNNTSLSGLNDQQALAYANALAVSNYIANMSKTYSAQAAGYEFEKVLSLLLGGAQVGGANGAADVVQATKNGRAFYSAKLLVDINDLSQSRRGTEGVDNMLLEGPIFYIAGIKGSGTSSSGKPKAKSVDYTEIYWYIIRINKNLTADYLDKSGTFQPGVTMSNTSEKIKVGKGNYNKYFAVMPILSQATADATAIAVGTAVSNFVDSSGNAMLKSAKEATRKLQNMEANTIEYRAVAGSGNKSSTGRAAADYVAQVANDFVSIKADFKRMFKTSVPGAQASDIQKFNESKKVTANLLKKLISETFKK